MSTQAVSFHIFVASNPGSDSDVLGSWRVLTLAPGESQTFNQNGPTDEGSESKGQTYTHGGDSVRCETWRKARTATAHTATLAAAFASSIASHFGTTIGICPLAPIGKRRAANAATTPRKPRTTRIFCHRRG